MTTDPFERAARREEHEEIAREMRKRWGIPGGGSPTSGMSIALIVFGGPYILIALIRAAGFDFGEPTLGQSLVDFFFGPPRRGFAIYTGWMLFLAWTWLIVAVSSRKPKR
jgi:hypothetical protein